MHHKKAQIERKHNGRPSLPEAMRAPFGERTRRRRFKADLRSIVSAAHLLLSEVTPPARVWQSLRVQLEKEGILSRVKSRLEEHTRFPIFRNYESRDTSGKIR